MSMAHEKLSDPRIARIMLMVGVIALVSLLSMDPVAAWDTTSMPNAGGGGSAWYYETTNTDPL